LRRGPATGLQSYVLLAYCAGLIAVCTGLLLVATVFTVKNYWLLRELSISPSGKHSAEESREAPREIAREASRGNASVRYDSGFPEQSDEWTGPVVAYTPTGRKPQ
jgi:hypothetical protein